MFNSKIIGVGAYTPSNVVSNEDLKKVVDTSDEWIKSRTGIHERRISTGENTSDLAAKAARVALDMANINSEDIDYIIVATITPDNYTPSTASMVQDKIGARNASAIDINAACTGFMYAMEIANCLIKNGSYKNILIIGAETLSKILDWNDRATCVLFGDGAGAAVLTRTQERGIQSIITGSDGSKGASLVAQNLAMINPFINECKSINPYITMNGGEVFKFATRIMEDSIRKVLNNAGVSLDEIDYIIPHQANYRIIEHVSKKLKIDISKFIINLDKYGNTSGASIPIALAEAIELEKIKKGDKIVLVGFGGGLTWGSVLLEY
ncbi:beta-ketoacyl-ACP synthase III [uncultured Clostridium sp.]|jgi:3-oxoacyl-[acyl-carrier-protein] synthase-3|uniref:beta-ketoacyl-ACP synthase III n=1 Tax=uncultured Clostridium sp. TaxID=59620 RepID=UPI002625BD1C|nr:beta-ketoacyl-ACP synthase III [uncultured Clostridium sp.]